MAINRRRFLQLSSAASLLGLGACSSADLGMLVGGFRTRDNSFGVAAIHPDGSTLWSTLLPDRVHDIALLPDLALAAVVARRPGTFVSLVRLADGEQVAQIDVPRGLIFEGHAAWRGSTLWVSAAEAETGAARMLGYSIASDFGSLRPDREIPLPGIGPHQVLNLDEGLVVALGGWISDQRTILNADNFSSALTWLDPASGTSHLLPSPEKGLSVRHLATDGRRVWAGLQYANPKPSSAPLVYETSGTNWQALPAPEQGWQVFSGYIGSLAAADGELLATSPQGHYFGRWDLSDRRCLGAASILDICPAAAGRHRWYLGSGTGIVRSSASGWQQSDFFWDNHWSYVDTPLHF